MTDGTEQMLGNVVGADGKDGAEVESASLNEDGELVISLTDGSEHNLGVVVGKDGKDGKDGLGIKDVQLNAKGELLVTFTDDSSKNIGNVSFCPHYMGEWRTVKEATCTSIGVKVRECSVCGYEEYDFVAEKGHTWDKGKEYDLFTLKICTSCGSPLYIPITYYEAINPVESPKVRMDDLGLYFVCAAGDSVYSILDGKVTAIGVDSVGGYAEIEHYNGLKSVYRRLVAMDTLKVGNTVERGDVIGIVSAASDASSQPRLYFELYKDGVKTDPYEYMDLAPVFFYPVESKEILHRHKEVVTNQMGTSLHNGIDVVCEVGDEVYSALDGTVISIEFGDATDDDNIVIEHENGYVTYYLYVTAVDTLKVGDKVGKGELIGTVCEPGLNCNSLEKNFGAHLHFLIKKGSNLDPLDYFDL